MASGSRDLRETTVVFPARGVSYGTISLWCADVFGKLPRRRRRKARGAMGEGTGRVGMSRLRRDRDGAGLVAIALCPVELG